MNTIDKTEAFKLRAKDLALRTIKLYQASTTIEILLKYSASERALQQAR